MTDKSYKMMQDVMECLVNMGYQNGDDIPYNDFSDSCYSIGISPDDIDMPYMETLYNIMVV